MDKTPKTVQDIFEEEKNYPKRVLNKKRNLNYRSPEEVQALLETSERSNEQFFNEDPY